LERKFIILKLHTSFTSLINNMKLIRSYQYIVIVFLLILLPFPSKAQKDLDKKIIYKSEELQKIRDELATHKIQLEKAKNKEKSLLSKLEETEKDISLTTKLVKQLKREQSLKEQQIEQTKSSINRLSGNLKSLKENFARRIVHIHKQGDYNDWELILTSQSLNQAIYRYKYLRTISDIDKKSATNIRLNISAINNKKMQLITELKDQEKIINEKKERQSTLSKQKQQRDRQLRIAQKDKSSLIAQIKVKEKAAAQLLNLISDLEKEREKRRQELERQRQLAGIRAENPFLESRGKLEWPVTGQIVSKFGMQKHPILKTVTENSGIDIKVRKGTPVRAVLDGVVTTITYIRGFGNTIIIDHGSGFYTVYSHVENMNVFEKEYITRNTIIAEVGDSGSLSGALLHFEIWSNRTKLNPEEWLAGRS